MAKLAEKELSEELIQEVINEFNLEVIAVTEEQSVAAGILRLATKPLGLSLGDRLCVALARSLSKPVITTDRPWEKLAIEGVEVRLLR